MNRTTEPDLTGVEMCDAVRARMRAMVCGMRMRRVDRGDAGMATSEYAVGIVAAVAFATVLFKVVTSEAVGGYIQAIFERALGAHG